jgi:uncharacterized protein with PQ loop repeat
MNMEDSLITNVIGYMAPATLVVSFFFKNIRILRSINTVGCILFVAYGLLISAYPVVVANLIIAVTNVYYLTKTINN